MGILRVLHPADLGGVPFTYAEVGATRDAELPAGYQHVERSVVVGSGPEAFERAVAAVFDWRMQRAVGLRVRATGPASEPGTVVVLTAGLPRPGYDIPCRVVWAQTSGDERGFAYGTLPGHPESGEEAFLVRLEPAGDVVFSLRVFARLASPLARLGGPVSTAVQRLATARYLTAVGQAARG
ncbi:Uncharacterized protein, UPF0548 family [Geodermatophilus obscurus]|jgi:uncharacterized protein (UPF0548 family)|uniref:Uncharacterized protein, UPF0548 family n=1 Tax=Geodermatophilus obscurus TaxID=1861 RepID=A0A1M7SZF0_9ACTN|nr:DUF1990 domain-containing protein [Geodermatophilus obscurus]SHN63842.1 Uncharacterized protein, UPF0548 family [Geodermatophilus obscurus]